MTLTDDEYAIAVRLGHEVAMAVAIRRFRDEYGWTEKQVLSVGQKLLGKIDEQIMRQMDSIAVDLTRMENQGGTRVKMSLHCTIVAAMALIGAQVCEGFELARRAGRN